VRNVVLYGFMGAGKTAVGQKLARLLGWPFLDTDRMVEEQAGKPIPRIFDEQGEAAFRALEREAVARAARVRPAVVACGGGAVLDPSNAEVLRSCGHMVWLRAGLEPLLARAASGDRPLLRGSSRTRAAQLLEERTPRYQALADVTVDTDGLEVDEVARRVLEELWRRETRVVPVCTSAGSYPVYVGEGVLPVAAGELARLRVRRAALLTHPRLWELYGRSLAEVLQAWGVEVVPVVVAPGERSKSLGTAARVYARMASAGLDRGDGLVALGGGVAGDLGGFVAGTYMRGIRFFQLPTTLMAQQHWQVFRSRFAAFPVRVEMVSRFRSAREVRRVLEDLASGAVDVVIGTHRLLQKDVRFKDLGLVIIDEEQRFGVLHKERLKQLRATVDVLTLTATPIPRTLHMSLVGLRDMSLMETPPDARQPIRTTVAEWSESLVQEAIRRELARGGQVYVVHNRVQTIERAARRVQALVPEARVAVAHGQLPEAQLERVMLDFVAGRYDVLVCTTIVEIGLDIPRVNTILVEDAHTLGLAQLYQLRGRVGRADQQAYAYLLYPRGARLTDEAKSRLEALREFVALGSGLRLAMRDLEIRGAGNLLGPEQHGHMAAVGFELYTRLLEEAIRRLRGEFVEELPDPVVELRLSAYLPEAYIPEERERLAAYRKLASARSPQEVAAVEEELQDRYGPLPEPVRNLVQVAALREMARALGVLSVSREARGILVRVRGGVPAREGRWLALEYRGRVEALPEGLLVRPEGGDDGRALHLVRELLDAWAALRRQRPQPVTA